MTSQERKAVDSDRPLRKGRPKVAADSERRTHIIDIASGLYLEHGYSGATMSMIAGAARVSLNTLYRLFPGKSDLFAAVTGAHRRSMVALPGDYDTLSVAEALERIFYVGIGAEAERRRVELARLLVAEAERSPELAAVFRGEGPDQTLWLIAEWLAHQRDLGRIQVADCRSAAKMLMDIAFGAPGVRRGGEPDLLSETDRATHLRNCFAIVARGFGAQG